MSKITQETLDRNKIIMNSFFQERAIVDKYRIPEFDKRYGYIYCIENKLNRKKYIGSTFSICNDIKNPHPYSALRKRASHYIYEYNLASRQHTTAKRLQRPIIQAFVAEDIENFIMYPIAETRQGTHEIAEKYFIKEYDSIENGYNRVSGANLTTYRGHKHIASQKNIRSDPIIAINMNAKQLVFADSMKLFGDFLGTSKDMIKNNVRSGRSYKGWFIFYINDEKRNYILNHYVLEDNLGVQKRGNPRYHSEKSKQFYSELMTNVTSYIKDSKSELFSDFTKLDDIKYIDD